MAESNNKGKGRAIPDDTPTDTESPSAFSRLTTSAKALLSDALTAPSSGELSITTASLTNSGKGRSVNTGGTGSSTWVESSKTSQLRERVSGSSNAFRTGHTQEHVAHSEQEFSSFLNGTSTLIAPEDAASFVVPKHTSVNEDKKQLQEFSIAFPTLSVVEQESRDGAEVSAMLSIDPREKFEAPEEDTPQESYDWGLSPEATARLRGITKNLLPPPPLHGGVSSQNELNLIPRFGEKPEHISWVEQWEGVLSRYSDEVWGGLLPLVKEAQREIQQTKDDRFPPNTTAIRRLQAILGHLGDHRPLEARFRGQEF